MGSVAAGGEAVKAYTDYPLGGGESRMREVEVLSYDGDKYARILADGVVYEIKAGHLHADEQGAPLDLTGFRVRKAKTLPGWWKPKYGWGGHWAGTGHLVILVEHTDLAPPKAATDISVIESLTSTVTEPVERVADHGRYAVYKRPSGAVSLADRHYVDLIESAYPGCAWGGCKSDMLGPMVARIGREPVAVLMPVMGTPDDAPPDPLEPPPCPSCDGHGGDACSECDGSGEVEHTCECGHEHEHDCETCDGKGWVKRCKACAGSGKWKPENESAQPREGAP